MTLHYILKVSLVVIGLFFWGGGGGGGGHGRGYDEGGKRCCRCFTPYSHCLVCFCFLIYLFLNVFLTVTIKSQ